MKQITKLPQPEYVTSDASGYYNPDVEKKDRFCIKYTYLILDQLVTTKKQSNGKALEDDMYMEYLLN